jgi:hypothetical protein
MNNYTKDRNLISIHLDGANGAYCLDIATGIFYGLRGAPVKTCTRLGEVSGIFSPYNGVVTNLAYTIFNMLRDCGNQTSRYPSYAQDLLVAEKIDAVGLPCLRLSRTCLAKCDKHIKELVKYSKDHNVNNFDYENFEAWCEIEEVKRKYVGALGTLTAEQYRRVSRYLGNLSIEEISACDYYLNRGKMWEYHCRSVDRLTDYLRMCRAMEMNPNKVNNFMREYCETKQYYENKKAEFDNRQMALNYARQAKAWEFSFGDFVVSIPSCGQDIVDEGKNMHHCVGSYVSAVVEGHCFICFVRHKDAPNDCYITCQVHNDGRIGQYFLAYDRYISDDEDIAFKEAFSKHLREVWVE